MRIAPYKSNAHHWPEAQRDMFNSKRYDPPAISGQLTENTTWSGIVRVSGDLTVPQGVTLDIQPGTKVIFQHGDDEKAGEDPTRAELIIHGTLNAIGFDNDPIEFFSYSKWYGIVVKATAEVNLDYCWIDRAEYGVEIKPATEPFFIHKINNCEISRCDYGIYVSANLTDIQNNRIHHNNTGIYLYETQFTLHANSIYDNAGNGIYLSNSSDGEITDNQIYSNASAAADAPVAGVLLYKSSPVMLLNQIYQNGRNGVLLLDNSFAVITENNLIGNNGPQSASGEEDWHRAEILMQDNCNPYMDYGHNDIVDTRPKSGYLMMHAGEVDELILVRGNYRGGGSPEGLLYSIKYYDYEDWDVDPNTTGVPQQMSTEEQLFITSLEAERQGDYTSAKSGYLQIISTYPDSIETAYSLPRLFVCEQALGGDFAQLESYYLNFSQTSSDSINYKIARSLARRCLVQQLLLNDAIVEYENIVQAPPSLADSIYAVIDIGDIYLLQEELNGGPNLKMSAIGGSSAAPQKPELTPASRKQFDEKKNQLLSLLFSASGKNQDSNIPQYYALSQNYPNPFNPATTIKYQLPKTTKVKLEVYNILGQKVRTLVDGLQPADYYKIEWDGRNNHGRQVGSGLYIYRLIAKAADGSENFVKVKKMLLIR